jgi:DNA polymerase elongation subunit (family B)
MYQAIYYDYSTYLYHLRDDVEGWTEPFKHSPTYYVEDTRGSHLTLEGKKVSPIWKLDNWKDPKYYEKDVEKTTRLLVDLYYENDDTPAFNNIIYLDIECEIGGALTPENIKGAFTKITAISLYDNNTKKYTCLILDDDRTYEEEGKSVKSFATEKELLKAFLDTWETLDPTIITGWNSGYFDIPYLYYRIEKVLGKTEALRLSPLRKVTVNDFFPEQPVKIAGVNHLDYMLLFKKFISKQEPSYKLGDIGIKYVNLGKLEYEGSLDKLFKEDIHKFIEYNIRDVEIIVALEDKLKFIDLAVTICHLCHVEYEKIYLSTSLNEGAILTYLKRKDIVSPNKPTTYNPSLQQKEEEYAGGYLKEPVPGLYEWVIDLDFTSLYPSIIRSLNLGIETLDFRIVNKDKYDNRWSLKELKLMDPNAVVDVEQVRSNRTIATSQMNVGKLIKYIEKNNRIISAPGVIFKKDKESIVCEILTDWFKKRQEYKALMKKAYKEGDMVKYDLYNRRQHAYKIKLNDVYGVFAINGWRYTDGNKFISKAITLTGQRLTQESIKFVNSILNKELNNKKDYIITSDTDSLFISIKELLKYRFPDLDLTDRKAVVPKALTIANEIQQKANEHLNTLVVELFNLHDREHYFELKQEVVLERGYFAGKRRYAQFIINKEGMETEELDMKGLDLMKSNFPPLFKKFGEEIIKEIMFGKDKEHIDEKLMTFRRSLNTIDWKHLLKPTGLKKMKEYLERDPHEGEIFSYFKSRCPINTRAATYYNDILKHKKLEDKYPLFQVGDKMKICYIKPNPYNIEVIGFNGFNDPPEIIELIETYVDRSKIFDSVMKNKLDSLYSDLSWTLPVYNKNILKFFKTK